jgi:hypothetical protein
MKTSGNLLNQITELFRRKNMKREMPQGLIIGAIVLIVLCISGIAWRSLVDRTPAPERLQAIDLKTDPIPDGANRDRLSQSGSQASN